MGNRLGEGLEGIWGFWSSEKPGPKVGAVGVLRLRGFSPRELIQNEANPVGTEHVVLAVVPNTPRHRQREVWAVTSTGFRVQ